jgi:hypothetical protein
MEVRGDQYMQKNKLASMINIPYCFKRKDQDEFQEPYPLVLPARGENRQNIHQRAYIEN